MILPLLLCVPGAGGGQSQAVWSGPPRNPHVWEKTCRFQRQAGPLGFSGVQSLNQGFPDGTPDLGLKQGWGGACCGLVGTAMLGPGSPPLGLCVAFGLTLLESCPLSSVLSDF